jgi:hypothetical protein
VTGLEPEEIARYLSVLRALKSSCRLYDAHVHPYEVLFDKLSYDRASNSPGLLSLLGRCYAAPAVSRFSFTEPAGFDDEPGSQRLRDISVMLLSKVYGHVGEQVFFDQLNLSGMDQVLLLPIAPDSPDPAPFDKRMLWVNECYADRDRFSIAGSIPAALRCEEISAYAANLRRQYGIKAIKCHPVVSGIDLGTSARKVWLETMLSACSESRLPVVIHGGRNNPYWRGSRGNFGALQYLKEIDFSLSREPVIIAHAGFHCCGVQEIEQEGVPILKKMLKTHSNLYVDISGLGLEPLKRVLQSVGCDRILFGSDALYSQQWEVVALTMHALAELGMKLEERFVQIASINPEKTIFKDEEP